MSGLCGFPLTKPAPLQLLSVYRYRTPFTGEIATLAVTIRWQSERERAVGAPARSFHQVTSLMRLRHAPTFESGHGRSLVSPPCSPCVSGSRAGIWYPSRGRNGLTPGHDLATSGRFCRLRIYERIIGIFLTRSFLAAYLTNAKMTRDNRPEVRFQGENRGQNLRNRPEVNWRQQKSPCWDSRQGLASRVAHSMLADAPVSYSTAVGSKASASL